ncbi:MAG: shikimate dehydrogenase, partial [Coriobacteriia bacterium]|nr:shikimate dehydrogenase [Coriobacteriia bacterium]
MSAKLKYLAKYLVVGTPIAHSLSPALHNTVYEQLELNRELVARDPGNTKDFAVLLQDLRAGQYQGFCVTIPYKLAAAHACDDLSFIAQRTGAANYIRRNSDGSLSGDNTDVVGFLNALDMQLGLKPAGLNVCICGSGGAAKAACEALLMHGVSQVTMVSRNPTALIGAIGNDSGAHALRIVSYDTLHQMDCRFDLLVNATPLGMDNDLLPVRHDWMHSATDAVFDIVYRRDGITPLVAAAQRMEIPAIDGRAMLIEQAAYGMHFWGVDADVAQLR